MSSKRSRPSLWVIDPAMERPEHQGVAEILDGWPGDSRVFRPSLNPGDGPSPATGYETNAAVVMGSAASVTDCIPWIEELSAWLRPVIDGRAQVALLGICFGHQLIAHLAGGEIGFVNGNREKVLGVSETEVDGGRLMPGAHCLRVIVSHREQVRRVPSGYRVVARRPEIPVDGLEHETWPIFSFQFHPEAREEFASHVGIDSGLLDTRLRADSRKVLKAFRDLVLAD